MMSPPAQKALPPAPRPTRTFASRDALQLSTEACSRSTISGLSALSFCGRLRTNVRVMPLDDVRTAWAADPSV